MTTYWRNRKHCQKVRFTHKPRKKQNIYDSGMKTSSKQNKTRKLTIKKITHSEELKILNI